MTLDKDERVVELADPFEFIDHSAYLQIHPFHLGGKDLHLPNVQTLLVIS